jgi:hypothetical protein
MAIKEKGISDIDYWRLRCVVAETALLKLEGASITKRLSEIKEEYESKSKEQETVVREIVGVTGEDVELDFEVVIGKLPETSRVRYTLKSEQAGDKERTRTFP